MLTNIAHISHHTRRSGIVHCIVGYCTVCSVLTYYKFSSPGLGWSESKSNAIRLPHCTELKLWPFCCLDVYLWKLTGGGLNGLGN